MSHVISAIRPEEVHQKYGEILQSDIAQLFSRVKTASPRPCPLCQDANNWRKLVSRPHGSYLECLTCGLVYLDRIPPPNELKRYFQEGASSSFFHEKILFPTASTRKTNLFSSRMDLLKELGVTADNSVVLDIGCSIGSFLELVSEQGIRAYGLEPNLKAKEIAQSCGQTVFGSWEELKRHLKPHSVDFLTAWEVLAHLEDLQYEMESIAQILKPGGYLVLTTPNVQGLEYRLLKEEHPNFNFPFLQLFSIKALQQYISKSGFQCQQISTPGGHDVETIGHYLQNRIRKDVTPYSVLEDLMSSETPESILFRQELQQSIVKSQLSGHTRLIARKI